MPTLELYNPLNPQGVPQDYLNADRLGNITGQFPSSYDFAKTFVTPATNAQGGGNGVTTLDDPTYLGFNIRFDAHSPLFNGAEEGSPSVPNTAGSGGAPEAGQINTPNGESAVGYLETVGESTRATYLRGFIQGMREIEKKRPYYFQTIEGITEAWNKTVTMTPFVGSADGEGITVGLLEAIDLKMSALFSLYKAACYDVKYRRTVLPINLMYFNVYVDVLEIRKFHKVRKAATAGNPNSPENDLTKFVNENTSMITFKFTECKWDATASGTVFANVTNVSGGGAAFATSSMKWSYGNVEVESQFSGYDSALKDTANLQPKTLDGQISTKNKLLEKQSLGELAESKFENLKDNAVKGFKNFAERTVNSFTQGLALGNVFGLRNDLVNTVSNPQGLINSLNGAAIQTFAGQSAQGINQSIDDNIFAGQTPSFSGGLDSTTLFSPQPSGPPLNSTNIFG